MRQHQQPGNKILAYSDAVVAEKLTRSEHTVTTGTQLKPRNSLSDRVVLNNISDEKNPYPWTWHPHFPGVTTAWLAHANGVSARTISRWRRISSPADVDFGCLNADLGLVMATSRLPGAVLPLWSRMAIAQLALEGASYTQLARQFRCGKSTIWRCIRQGSHCFSALSAQRVLTKQQRRPVRNYNR